jgi:hypothetical protein
MVMPKWLKIVLGIVVALIILSVIGIGGCMMFVFNLGKDMQDPAKIQKVLNEMVEMQEPTPKGFSYAFALNMAPLADVKFVLVNYEPTHMYLMLGKMPIQEKKTPEEIAADLGSKGVQGASVKFESKSKGTEKVAGQDLIYAIGTATDKQGENVPAMIGIMATPMKKDTFFVYGTHKNMMQNSSSKDEGTDKVPTEFDWKDTQIFLHSIKAIKD